MRVYEAGSITIAPGEKLNASMLSEVRAHSAWKTYQLDPTVAPSGAKK